MTAGGVRSKLADPRVWAAAAAITLTSTVGFTASPNWPIAVLLIALAVSMTVLVFWVMSVMRRQDREKQACDDRVVRLQRTLWEFVQAANKTSGGRRAPFPVKIEAKDIFGDDPIPE